MSKIDFRFEENDKVAHIANVKQLMFVKEVKRKTITLKHLGKDVNKIDGIIVYYFEGAEGAVKVKKEDKFHSDMLVPYDIAQEGQDSIDKWFEDKLRFNATNSKRQQSW